MRRFFIVVLTTACSAPLRDDGTAAAQKQCKKRSRSAPERRACVKSYLERKASATSAAVDTGHIAGGCDEPTDQMSNKERLSIDQCLHTAEKDNSEWLHAHISQPATACGDNALSLSPTLRSHCLLHAGVANWTGRGLVDGQPECGRTWMAAECARKLLANRNLMFIGNSVIRRQMYTVIDLLAGPSARRIAYGGGSRTTPEVLPTKESLVNAGAPPPVSDAGELDDPALRTQEGVLNSRIVQSAGPAWTATSVKRTRMWDRGDEPNAYHAAQLVTMDLVTGAHRFHRPHSLCGLGDTFSKFRSDRSAQFRKRGDGRGGGALSAGWQSTKWAGREWRPIVSFRWYHGHKTPEQSCAEPSVFLPGSRPNALEKNAFGVLDQAAGLDGEDAGVVSLRSTVRSAVKEILRKAGPQTRLEESLANITVQIEHPVSATGPNVWVLFPTYHGERQSFNGFCEDNVPGCECTDKVGTCTHKFCRGKKLCRTLPPTSAVFVEHARSLSKALLMRGELNGGKVARVQPSVFYDDCWNGRGRCQGRRPCLEPGDHMLSCRATAMLCATPWSAVLAKAKDWIPSGHSSASFLYVFDGPSQDLFDETFRTWSKVSVGYGADIILFGPQFASAKPRLLNTSLGHITSAIRRTDACSRRKTTLIFRSPAFNIDPVNTFRQQRTFARRVRPMVERLGVAFLDTYTATRHAVLQRTPYAVRFDHFSAFHFHDTGRYIQAELFLHALRLLSG